MTDAEALVFVVDDDASLRTSLQDLLESVGLRVAACASAQDFLRRPRPEGPSCLVLVDAAPFEAATWASTFGPESSLPGRVWASRAPVCIPDVVQDPGLLRAPHRGRRATRGLWLSHRAGRRRPGRHRGVQPGGPAPGP